jgi:hypothetical protein
MLYVGLDLGQSNDFTAIAIVERFQPRILWKEPESWPASEAKPRRPPNPPEQLHLRWLERIRLGTPYPRIVDHVVKLTEHPQLQRRAEVVLDATGVGAAVLDLFKARNLHPTAVKIHGGENVSSSGGGYGVPKRDLVSAALVALQSGKLRIARELEFREELVRELLAFKPKIDPLTAHDSYNSTGGAHDDLVIALALALWRAAHRPASYDGIARITIPWGRDPSGRHGKR